MWKGRNLYLEIMKLYTGELREKEGRKEGRKEGGRDGWMEGGRSEHREKKEVYILRRGKIGA